MPIFIDPDAEQPAPPEIVESPDGLLKAVRRGMGVLLAVDFSAVADVRRVRFVRDGTVLVRSGNDAWAPGGYAYAYDNEAAPGEVVTYQAYPIGGGKVPADRTPETGAVGEPTDSLAITIPAVDAGKDCWLKSIEDPTLSMPLRMMTPDPEEHEEGRNSFSQIVGSKLPASSWDVAVEGPQTFTFKTYTHDENRALKALLDSGPLLWQGSEELEGIEDFYALRVSRHTVFQVGVFKPIRLHTVAFQPINRPTSLDAPMVGAGRSYDWLSVNVETYDDIPLIWPTYPDIIGEL